MALFFKNEDHIEETFAKHIMRKAKTSSTACYVHYVRAFVFKRPTARTRTRVLATRSSSGFKVFARLQRVAVAALSRLTRTPRSRGPIFVLPVPGSVA